MLAEERQSAPRAQLSRRNLFAAATIATLIPAISPAGATAGPCSELAAILARRNSLADAINHGDLTEGLSEEEAQPIFDRCWGMDDVIHDAPIRSHSDAATKLAHLVQLDVEGFHIASPGTIAIMKQVVAFLEAK